MQDLPGASHATPSEVGNIRRRNTNPDKTTAAYHCTPDWEESEFLTYTCRLLFVSPTVGTNISSSQRLIPHSERLFVSVRSSFYLVTPSQAGPANSNFCNIYTAFQRSLAILFPRRRKKKRCTPPLSTTSSWPCASAAPPPCRS